MNENSLESKVQYAYLVTSDGSFFSPNANAYQKCKLVVDCLDGVIIVPKSRRNWVHQEFLEKVHTFNFPDFLLKKPFVVLTYPIIYIAGVLAFREKVSNWIFAPSNEGTFLGVWLVEVLFRIKVFLFCWDPPGINIRDRRDITGTVRCRFIDWLMGKAVGKSALMILNLHPDFVNGRFPSNILNKIRSFPNGTDIAANKLAAKDVQQVVGRIGINSKFEKVKGCWSVAELLVALWKTHKTISVVWVGDGKEYSGVYEYLRKEGIPESKLIMPGQVPPREAIRLLATAQVALNCYDAKPSLKWNYVLKLPEFMSIGIPVVSADSLGVREYLEDGISGIIFKPGDWNAVSQILDELLTNNEKRIAMAAKALHEVVRYDWQLINKHIADVIRDMI